MKSVTFIKLTNEERIALARANEILHELQEHLGANEQVESFRYRAVKNLDEVMSYLEDMGNDFRIPWAWDEVVEEALDNRYEPGYGEDPEEMMADCWEFTFEK